MHHVNLRASRVKPKGTSLDEAEILRGGVPDNSQKLRRYFAALFQGVLTGTGRERFRFEIGDAVNVRGEDGEKQPWWRVESWMFGSNGNGTATVRNSLDGSTRAISWKELYDANPVSDNDSQRQS